MPPPLLPLLGGVEDPLQVPAVVATHPELLQQPLPVVRLERGQRRGPARRQEQVRPLRLVIQRSVVLLVLQVEAHDLLPDAQVLVVAGTHPG